MIQVYKKNELFIIENTVTDIIYPNLTREEALVLLEKFDRNETEHRCDFAIKEDDISFEYVSLDDKDKTIAEQRKQITDLEAKLAEKDAELWKWSTQYAKAYVDRQNALIAEKFGLQQQLAKKDAERELDNSFWKQECDSLQKTLAEKDKEIERLKSIIGFYKSYYISFREKVVDELEKVKEFVIGNCGLEPAEGKTRIEISKYIKQQIALLKGKVEDDR